MSFKNYWADLLEIFIESVKVYTNCVYEISQRSESNSVFENQKIEITYKNYSSLDTWATLMKQKLNYSQSVEQEHDTFRYVKNSLEKYGVIRIEFSHIYINVTNDVVPPPPLSNYDLFLAILPVFESFPWGYTIRTFFMITKQRGKISSLNFLCICIIRIWLKLYKYIFMTSLMTLPVYKIGQILKLIYLRQYLNYSVDQNLKMFEMLMAIFLVYSTSNMTSGKKFAASSKWRPFWKFWNIKHSFNLT